MIAHTHAHIYKYTHTNIVYTHIATPTHPNIHTHIPTPTNIHTQ